MVYFHRSGWDIKTLCPGLSQTAGDHLSLGSLYSKLPPAVDSFSGLHGLAGRSTGGRQVTGHKHVLPARTINRLNIHYDCSYGEGNHQLKKKKWYPNDACSCRHQISPLKAQDFIWRTACGKEVVKPRWDKISFIQPLCCQSLFCMHVKAVLNLKASIILQLTNS